MMVAQADDRAHLAAQIPASGAGVPGRIPSCWPNRVFQNAMNCSRSSIGRRSRQRVVAGRRGSQRLKLKQADVAKPVGLGKPRV